MTTKNRQQTADTASVDAKKNEERRKKMKRKLAVIKPNRWLFMC